MPSTSHPSPAQRTAGKSAATTMNGRERAESAEDGEERDVVLADAHVEGRAERLLGIALRLAQAQRDHRGVRDREREHRAERVEVAEERDALAAGELGGPIMPIAATV